MVTEARWYESAGEGATRCTLCPCGCVCKPGESGRCLGRVNRDGTLMAETYARPASIALDPMEKKPLYHFMPGTAILSMGTYGCNLTCSFCQNWSLSQEVAQTDELTVENVVRMARGRQAVGVAYTYNEPTVWYEYVYDCAVACHQAGLKNVLVTNGYIAPEPFAALLPYVDALNIDIKSFRDAFYRELCGGRLEPVLAAARQAASQAFVEITNLVIPGHNDAPAEQDELAAWIAAELGATTPVHVSAYHPRHKLQAEPATAEVLLASRERFLKHLKYVYLGNLVLPEGGDTQCPACGAVAVRRQGYQVDLIGLTQDGRCAACSGELNIVC